MDFELSEEQEMLRNGLRELLERACDIRHVRNVALDGDAREPGLWNELAKAGWTGLTAPEEDGGAGLEFEDLMVIAVEAGRAILHLPLVTTLLAARTIAKGTRNDRLRRALADIAAGSSSVTLALRGSPEDWNGEQPGIRAEREGEGWRLSGELRLVPYGPLADDMLVEAALGDGGRGLFLLPTGADGAGWTALAAMDSTVRQYRLALNGSSAGEDASVFGSDDAGAAIERLLDEWRTLLAAESLGTCEKMLERAVDYAKERVAFGRPIGANQAIKVRVAEMGAQIERMRSAVYYAAMKLHGDAEDSALAAAMAKAATAYPAVFVGTNAIHVHGGLGFTWEHDMHLYFKRVKSNELFLGDGSASLRRVAAAVI